MELDIKTVTGGPLDVNTYVVGASGSSQCVLIDPGAEYAAVSGAVCGREVTAVLLTHAHFDHMLYARPWLKDGVKLYVHKLDAPALADPSLNLSGVVGAQLFHLAGDKRARIARMSCSKRAAAWKKRASALMCCTRRDIRRARSVIGMKRRCFAATRCSIRGMAGWIWRAETRCKWRSP